MSSHGSIGFRRRHPRRRWVYRRCCELSWPSADCNAAIGTTRAICPLALPTKPINPSLITNCGAARAFTTWHPPLARLHFRAHSVLQAKPGIPSWFHAPFLWRVILVTLGIPFNTLIFLLNCLFIFSLRVSLTLSKVMTLVNVLMRRSTDWNV